MKFDYIRINQIYEIFLTFKCFLYYVQSTAHLGENRPLGPIFTDKSLEADWFGRR